MRRKSENVLDIRDMEHIVVNGRHVGLRGGQLDKPGLTADRRFEKEIQEAYKRVRKKKLEKDIQMALKKR